MDGGGSGQAALWGGCKDLSGNQPAQVLSVDWLGVRFLAVKSGA